MAKKARTVAAAGSAAHEAAERGVAGAVAGAAGGSAAGAGVAAELVVADLETLRVLADPMRMRIIESMSRDAEVEWTVKQLARSLDMTPTKLYYHVNLLEERGLVRVTGSRIVSGIVEKRYRIAARSFRVDRTLLSPVGAAADETIGTLVSSVFDAARDEIEDAVRKGVVESGADARIERRLALSRGFARLPVERAREFHDRFQALVTEFTDDDSGTDVDTYGLLIALYPMATLKKPRPRRASRPSPATNTLEGA